MILGYWHFRVRLYVSTWTCSRETFQTLKCWYAFDRLINCISDILAGVPWAGCTHSGLPVKCIISLADASTDAPNTGVRQDHQQGWRAGKFAVWHEMCICWAPVCSRHRHCGWSDGVNYDCSLFELLPFESCANKGISACCKNPHAGRLV